MGEKKFHHQKKVGKHTKVLNKLNMLDEISGKASGKKETSQNKYPDEEQYKYRYEKQNVLCSYSLLSTSVKTLIFHFPACQNPPHHQRKKS